MSQLFDVLEVLIRCFEMSHLHTWDSSLRAEGECLAASEAFAEHLTTSGFALQHEIVEFWVEPVDGLDGENHFANVIPIDGAEVVVDWTARQFDDPTMARPEYPVVEPLERYLALFGWERYETAAANRA